MKRSVIRQILFPLLTAFIWGTSFVAQSVAADEIGPFTFNLARSLIAAVILFAVCAARRLLRRAKKGAADRVAAPRPPEEGAAGSFQGGPAGAVTQLQARTQAQTKTRADASVYLRRLILGGVFCGAALFAASNLQQAGMAGTSPGKAGFITALYIVLVPVLGLLLKKRPTLFTWLGVALAVAGLYFLCITEGLSVSRYDLLVLLCALAFAVHILVIDRFTRWVDGFELSCVQFAVCAALSGVCAAAFETPSWAALCACALPLLFTAVLSSCVGYTLQILAQKDANPTVVALLLSMESVFAAVSGALVLREVLTARETLGCALMLAAVVLAQIPPPRRSCAAGRKE